jgi:regulator of protease activity HflC (stomatin/prohibitin superfamily)
MNVSTTPPATSKIENEPPHRSLPGRLIYWIKDHLPLIIVGVLIAAVVILTLWQRIFIMIRPGEAGVIYRPFSTGTVTDYVYPEGLHILSPFNTMHIYDARVQIQMHEFDVLTNRGLPIKLYIAIRYQPIYELISVLHQQVGPNYPHKIILPQIESVLRRNIGQYSPEDIFTNKEGVLSNIITLALEEVGRKYVKVDDIIIRALELPETVRKAIEEKLIHEQRLLAYDFRIRQEEQEAERKRIEALGIMLYQDIISETLDDQLIKWQGVQATMELSRSENAKVVVIGSGDQGLPVILGNQ